MTKTKKTKLLFLALFLAQLKPGGRYACIVPHGVLFGSSTAHQQIRQTLVDGHKLDGVISMPSGVFKPYAGVSTAILLFTKTNFGGTDHVWFYDMTADGFSLDDKRDPTPDQNDIPDILEKWQRWRSEIENQKSKIENRKLLRRPPRESVLRPGRRDSRQQIRPLDQPLQGDRLRGREVRPAAQNPRPFEALEAEITTDLKTLRGMLR